MTDSYGLENDTCVCDSIGPLPEAVMTENVHWKLEQV